MTRTLFRLIVSLAALALCVVALRAYAVEISNVSVTEVTDSSATITWKTDVKTDGTINFGLDSRVGTIRDSTFENKDHTLTIDRLDPSTTYHFRVVSSDVDDNTNAASGYVFTTKNSASTVKKILKEIEKIKEPEELKEIQEKVQEALQDEARPPAIVGAPKVVPGSDTAEVVWTTDKESTSMVYLATESEYTPSAKSPYPNVQGDPRALVKKHKVTVTGLEQATVYHFKVVSEDDTGLAGETEDDTFRTKSTLPEIINPRVLRIQEKAATVSWSTGSVLAKGVVEYTNLRTKKSKTAGNPTYAVSQSILLADLEFGSRYSAVIRATNQGGDEIASEPLTFVTVRDVVAPIITKVNNESTLFPGEEVKIQTIISWETDEPTTCQVSYAQGLARAEGDEGDSLPPETNPVTAHTSVIVGFASATVYQFWVHCADESGNKTRSDDFVLITPVKEKSIIDIILENFEGTFGWVKNISN